MHGGPTNPTDGMIAAEFYHQDSLLQAYRQQFLVAETFTAAVAAASAASGPAVSLALSVLGVLILAGWILVTTARAKVLYHWADKLRALDLYKESFDRKSLEPSAWKWARFWLGGDRIGVFQLAFLAYWIFLIAYSLGART